MGWGWDARCPPPRPQPGAATSPPGAARSIPGNVPPARSRGGAAAAGLSLWLMSERQGDREKIEGGGGENRKKNRPSLLARSCGGRGRTDRTAASGSAGTAATAAPPGLSPAGTRRAPSGQAAPGQRRLLLLLLRASRGQRDQSGSGLARLFSGGKWARGSRARCGLCAWLLWVKERAQSLARRPRCCWSVVQPRVSRSGLCHTASVRLCCPSGSGSEAV